MAHANLTGRTIRSTYRVMEGIGSGAMGEVYRAWGPQGWVALKVLHEDLIEDAGFAARFTLEAETLERLHHPNIVPAYDHFIEHGRFYIAMAFVEGESLGTLLDREVTLPVARALAIVKPILSALDHVHRHGIIHRDVKPSNIMIDREGKPMLCDFGIVRKIGGRALTRIGSTIGTLGYMSPEQLLAGPGTPPFNHTADVYACGVVLYEMLTGRHPFDEKVRLSDEELRRRHVEREAVDPCQVNPAIPAALGRIVLKAMRREATRRYRGCADFLDAIEQFERHGSLVVARPRGTRRYLIYEHAVQRSEAVEQGFSWPALLNLLWLAKHGMYGLAAAWSVAWMVLLMLAQGLGLPLALAGGLVLMVLPVVRGNAWIASKLLQQGYRPTRQVAAPTREMALSVAARPD